MHRTVGKTDTPIKVMMVSIVGASIVAGTVEERNEKLPISSCRKD